MRRRGPYGRKASVTLRSVYPIVLGLGGWFLGVLIVLAPCRRCPSTTGSRRLSIGVPIGLGIYLAWVTATGRGQGRRLRGGARRRARRRVARVQRDGDLVAVITTIVGATAGANLALLMLDMAKTQPGTREAATEAPVLEGASAH